MRIKIKYAQASEGPLYTKPSEDGIIHCFYSTLHAVDEAGNVWEHNEIAIPGHHETPEGFFVPNYNYKAEIGRHVDRVNKVLSIDPDLWTRLPEPSLEDSLEQAAIAEAEERACGAR